MFRRTLLTTAALGLGMAFGTTAMAQDKTKACFVYVGPVGDGGWTYQHDQGRLAVEAAYGDKVETVFQENVPEGADAERVLRKWRCQAATSSSPRRLAIWTRPMPLPRNSRT